MKHIKNFRPLVLAAILVVTSAAAAVCGLVMKGQLQKYVGGYDDKWAIAVPFLMLRDDTDWQRMLAAKDAPPAPDPEPSPILRRIRNRNPSPSPSLSRRWWSPTPYTARTRAFSTTPCSSATPGW